MHVLVVEDEWLIAEELCDLLRDVGHSPIGPALNCFEALELLRQVRPDIAVLDTQLGNETCEAVLEKCVEEGIAVIISSGHDRTHLQEIVGDRILLPKPHEPGALAKALAAALAT